MERKRKIKLDSVKMKVYHVKIMRRKQIVVASLILSAIVIGGIAFLFLRSTREPVYQGKPLSVWLKEYDIRKSGNATEIFGPNWREANKAVKQAGTKAIPTLLRLLREEDLNKHNLDINGNEASDGFAALGANAKDAMPSLMEIYEQHPAARVDDLYCLGCIGPAAKDAVPWLLQKLPDTNGEVRSQIITTLGEIHAQPDQVVPVLINYLNDSNKKVRAYSALALSYYGTDAKPAVPALFDLLNDKDTRFSATFALKRIDPEAAAKAGLNYPEAAIKAGIK
jgi:HEAT repeat protein